MTERAQVVDLEQAYDCVGKEGLWKVLHMYGVGGKLLNGFKGYYVNSKVCAMVTGKKCDWFGIKQGPGLKSNVVIVQYFYE